ncbi:MAG TPA: DUF1109 domain-containing protein [Burkholderiales bacterium]
MRTEDLVRMLAAGDAPASVGGAGARYALALGWGAFAATLVMALTLGVRPDLAEAARLPMFWAKLAWPAALAAAALLAALRLSRPGRRLARVPVALGLIVLAMWGLAGISLARAELPEWPALVLGSTWRSCPLLIAALAMPLLAGALWAMKGLAPTRLALAGGAAGLLAGAGGALVYALHCPELAAPFLGVWYLAGMAIPAALGALAGPALLRW